MKDKEKMLEILKAHTIKHNIIASVVILEEYVDELIKNGCVITCINDEKMHDSDVIKALECCISSSTALACFKCPMVKNKECNGSNTNVNKLVVENALDLIKRLKAVSKAELDTIHTLGEDYEKALEEINRKNAEIEKLTVQKNAFAAGKKVEAEKVKEAQKIIKKLKADLKYYLESNEGNGVVYIPKYVIEQRIKELGVNDNA